MVCVFKHLYCSPQLSMSNMEKRNRNKIIIIIIIMNMEPHHLAAAYGWMTADGPSPTIITTHCRLGSKPRNVQSSFATPGPQNSTVPPGRPVFTIVPQPHT